MTKLDYIRAFASLGIACIPLYHRSKEPVLSSWREFQNRLPQDTEYLSWFASDWNNYAVVCGWNNLVVVDFDSIFYFDLWREWHCAHQATQYVSSGFQVRTRNGMHVYLRTEQAECNDKRIARSGGIDVQAQGKYVVGPMCVHPTGHVYEPRGEFVFPVVESVESVLPLDLFPRVAHEPAQYRGGPVALTHTEYLGDPLAFSTLDLISKVKALAHVEDFYPQKVQSDATGRWYKALCIFHDDHHYSAWIDVSRQLAGCQVCGMRPMDAINLYSRTRGMSESAAVRAMAEELGVWR